MSAASISSDLLCELTRLYESDATQFLHIPQQQMTSAFVREAIAELRNEGYLEEEMRGVVRLTARGYKLLTGRAGRKRNPANDSGAIGRTPAWA